VEPVLDRFLHARDVDSVIALDPGQRTELAQEIWRDAERAGGDVQTAGAAVEAAGRSERRKRAHLAPHRWRPLTSSTPARPPDNLRASALDGALVYFAGVVSSMRPASSSESLRGVDAKIDH
jgi:hypothetical protein